jgi:hypothetical protein
MDADKALADMIADLAVVTKRLQDHPTKFRVAIQDHDTLKELDDAILELRELTLTIITR